MAANHSVKLKPGTSVTGLFVGEMKQHFNIKGTAASGELVGIDDASIKIAYKVQGDSATFTVTKCPRLFKEADQKMMLKKLFG